MNPIVAANGPAHDVQWFLKAMRVEKAAPAGEKQMAFKAVGSTPEGVIYGFGAAAGNANKLDKDGEFFSKADLIAMAHEFCAKSDKEFRSNHQAQIDCELVESVLGTPIIKDGKTTRPLGRDEYFDPRTMELRAIDVGLTRKSHWFVGVRPKDQKYRDIAAKGGIAGFSVGVMATRVKV